MEKISEKKLYILMGALLIIVFIILRSLILSDRNQLLDYSAIESGEDVIKNHKLTFDREIYYTLDGILEKFINAYSDIGSTRSYKDYYKTLNSEYKKELSKSEFIEECDKFFSVLKISTDSVMEDVAVYQTENIIRTIYDLDDDMYVCVVGLTSSNEYAYIGIKLNTTQKTFEIFYI